MSEKVKKKVGRPKKEIPYTLEDVDMAFKELSWYER